MNALTAKHLIELHKDLVRKAPDDSVDIFYHFLKRITYSTSKVSALKALYSTYFGGSAF